MIYFLKQLVKHESGGKKTLINTFTQSQINSMEKEKEKSIVRRLTASFRCRFSIMNTNPLHGCVVGNSGLAKTIRGYQNMSISAQTVLIFIAGELQASSGSVRSF